MIKWNPAIKTQADKDQLWEALLDDRIDVIATDHAPHTLEEKKMFILPRLLAFVSATCGCSDVRSFSSRKNFCRKIVEKMAHNPAKIFKIEKRGFIKEGYYADLVIVDSGLPWSVKKENILYKCGWSPFEGFTFKSRITHTFVNGELVYNNFKVKDIQVGKRLQFDR